jgi:hypothetical protein
MEIHASELDKAKPQKGEAMLTRGEKETKFP